MAFAFSPSNLSQFVACPRRFEGQAITKEIKWKATTQKSRGTLVHSALERAVKKGVEHVKDWDKLEIDTDYAQDKASMLYQLRESKEADVFTEHSIGLTRKLTPTDFFADDVYLRAKADFVVVPKDITAPIMVGDWKTGKRWDDEDFQLRIEALMLHCIYKHSVVQYAYYYVDTGETFGGSIDFSYSIDPVADILDVIKLAQVAIDTNDFPPQQNKFCKWCDFFQTPSCGL